MIIFSSDDNMKQFFSTNYFVFFFVYSFRSCARDKTHSDSIESGTCLAETTEEKSLVIAEFKEKVLR